MWRGALYLSGDLKGVGAEVDGEGRESGLVWADRAHWQGMRVNSAEIEEKPGHRPPFEGRVRKKLDFVIPEQDMRIVESVKVGHGQGKSLGEILAGLEGEAGADGGAGMFLGAYLAGKEAEMRGETGEAAERYGEAYKRAEAVLRLRYVDEDGEPLRGLEVGPIRVICAQKQAGVVDEGVELVFAYEKTDENGYIYLPVYDTVLRFSELPEVVDGGKVSYEREVTGWFEVPGGGGKEMGRVGDLGDAVVHTQNNQ